uniref:NADH-ubiquinone oxidoreductase chain 2 n=1 Tax=Eucnemidae sp. 4 ACP-2013 TaxID=1434503 RepID=A0A3G4RY39_9COLE|nr:NADH dehydrogenase subunit 2 [Eucnemidae sp. 4 ACP-2013]
MFKKFFFMILIFSTLISISSYSWFGMWVGLEINLLSIIPLMLNSKNISSTESAIKYFITQSIASAILLMVILTMMIKQSFSLNEMINQNMIITSSMLMKLGAAPFHFWFPEVMEGLSWMNCMILLTWQKIAPMIIMMYVKTMFKFMIMVILICMMISGVMGISQTTLKKMLTYSSINNIGWMLSTMILQSKIWIIYFIIYSMTTINLILILKQNKIFTINQLIQKTKNSNNKMMLMLNFLNLSSIPPFIMFLPKWITLNEMINQNMIMIASFMTILTLLTTFMYMKIMMPSFMLSMKSQKMNYIKNYNHKKSMWNMIILMSLIQATFIFN